MVEIKLKQILQKHRFSVQMIHNETGISRSTLTDLYYNRTRRIDMDILDRLCIFFKQHYDFKITDLIDFVD